MAERTAVVARVVDRIRPVIDGLRSRLSKADVAALLLALAGGLVAAGVGAQLFPYRSPNHDEGVYLQQAAMLLDGKLFLHPPVPESFRPWFFVRAPDGALYPKYAPVPAATFAVGTGAYFG